MSESLRIGENYYLQNGKIKLSTMPVTSEQKKLFNILFNTPEKCQMAINAIKAGKMGNVSNYTPLLGELETKLKTEFRNTIFSTAKQQEMIPGWDYTTKELKLVLAEDAATDKTKTKDRQITNIVNSLESAKECQILIDTILDNGRYGKFDTPQELRALISAIEEKKDSFVSQDVIDVENYQWRSNMQEARKINNFFVNELIDNGQDVHNAARNASDNIGDIEGAAMYISKLFSSEEKDIHARLLNKATQFLPSEALGKLSRSANSMTIEEFEAEVEKLLGKDKFNKNILEHLSKEQTNYYKAKLYNALYETAKLERSNENIAKMEKALGGKEKLEKEINIYKTATAEEKFKMLKNLLTANAEIIKNELGNDPKKITETYEKYYETFIKNLGVTDVINEINELKEDAEYAGDIYKAGLILSTTIATAGLGTTAIIGAVGATSLGVEIWDRTTDNVDNLSSTKDKALVVGEAAIDALPIGAAVKTGKLITKSSLKPVQKFAGLVIADGTIGTAATFAHAKLNGKEITTEDVLLNYGLAFGASAIGATSSSFKNIKNAKKANTKPNPTEGKTKLDEGNVSAQEKANKTNTSNNSTQETRELNETTSLTTIDEDNLSFNGYQNETNATNKAQTFTERFNTFDETNPVSIDDIYPAKPQTPPVAPTPATIKPSSLEPAAVQKPTTTALTTLEVSDKPYNISFDDVIYIEGMNAEGKPVSIKLTKTEIESQALTRKDGRLGNKEKFVKNRIDWPKGTAIRVTKAQNGYQITVKGGEIKVERPQVQTTPQPQAIATTTPANPTQPAAPVAPKVTPQVHRAISNNPNSQPIKYEFINIDEACPEIWFTNQKKSIPVDALCHKSGIEIGESIIIGNVKDAKFKINAKNPLEIKITREADGYIVEQFQGDVLFKTIQS